MEPTRPGRSETPGFARDQRRLRVICGPDLSVKRYRVQLDGWLGDIGISVNFLFGFAFRQPLEYLQFARGQFGGKRMRWCFLDCCHEVDRGIFFAHGHEYDHVHHGFRRLGFQHKPAAQDSRACSAISRVAPLRQKNGNAFATVTAIHP